MAYYTLVCHGISYFTNMYDNSISSVKNRAPINHVFIGTIRFNRSHLWKWSDHNQLRCENNSTLPTCLLRTLFFFITILTNIASYQSIVNGHPTYPG